MSHADKTNTLHTSTPALSLLLGGGNGDGRFEQGGWNLGHFHNKLYSTITFSQHKHHQDHEKEKKAKWNSAITNCMTFMDATCKKKTK